MGKEVLQVLRRVLAGVESAQAECHTFGDLISRWSSGWMAGTLHFPSLVWQHAAPWGYITFTNHLEIYLQILSN